MLIIFSSISIIFVNSASSGSERIERTRANSASRIISFSQDVTISTETPWVDELVYLNGNLTIENGGVLRLLGTTLKMNRSSSPSDFVYEIKVESGGILIVGLDSVITRNQSTSDYELIFEPGSGGYIQNSTISYCGSFSELGIVIESDDVIFENCTLDDNHNGIYCNDASPTIVECEINNSDYASVICNNSALTLENCTLRTHGIWDAVVQNNSKLTLLSTEIINLAGIDITDISELATHWWLTVNITNVTGMPLQNATVNVMNSYGKLVFTGETDANGQVKNIECTQKVENATDINSSTPHQIEGIMDGYQLKSKEKEIDEDMFVELILELEPETGKISGYINDSTDNPIEGVNVTVTFDGTMIWGLTNAAGRYELLNVPSGTNYTVTTEAKIKNLTAYETGANESVAVLPNNITVVNFTLIKKSLPVTVRVQSKGQWLDADDATDVNVDTDIKIEFDHPMDNIKINTNNIKLKLGGQEILGNITQLNEDIKKEYLFSFEPLVLKQDTAYEFIIKEEVRKLEAGIPVPVFWENYVIGFTTEIDPVIQINPPNNAVDVDPTNPNIFAVFHNKVKLNKTSLEHAFKLKVDSGYVAGELEIDSAKNRVTFKPSSELQGATDYTAEIWDDLRDENGELVFRSRIGESWTFRTKKTTTEVNGFVLGADKKPIEKAKVVLISSNGTTVATTYTNQTGEFEITGIKPGSYKLKITLKNYETYQKNIITLLDKPFEAGTVELKEEKGDGEEVSIDPMWLGIIALIIIIIIIILALMMRKPRIKEEPEEEMAEERIGPPARARYEVEPPQPRAPAPSYVRAPPSRTVREEMTPAPAPERERPAMMQKSMNRCPICSHKLMANGECFHCKMDQMYGR